MCASTIKWIAFHLWKGFRESDSTLYTNFAFCGNKFIDIQKAHLFTKPSNLRLANIISTCLSLFIYRY